MRTPSRLPLKDFFDQIVHDVAVVAGEGSYKLGYVLAPAQREGCQLEAGNPAFGARFQCGDICRREVEAHHLVEKVGSFGRRKPQVGGAQLGQLVPNAQTGQRERWILAGGNDQVDLGGQALDQKGKRIVNRLGINDMVIIQHEDKRILDGGDVIEQRRQNRLGGRRLRRLERAQDSFTQIHHNLVGPMQGQRLQGRDEVSQKAVKVVIAFV